VTDRFSEASAARGILEGELLKGKGWLNPPPQPLLDISQLNGSPWVNPAFDTSDPNWSANVVGGQTFDGSAAHKFEWVSVLNPDVEQDDEVGLTGTAIKPDDSGNDLPFTHPFGHDFEFTITPDPAYADLLATANKNSANPTYADSWAAAAASGIAVPSGLLPVEIDGPLVPANYRIEHGDRIAVYGRWIVDAGHNDFHSEIHPPLLMARARSVDGNGNVTAASQDATTLLQLWSRPYQSDQLFTDGGQSGLALRDYVTNVAETLGAIKVYPPIFPKPFQGVHIVCLTVRPPVPVRESVITGISSTQAPQLECSYHFTVNGGCGVEVITSPADPHAVLVILALNSVGYPTLPQPASNMQAMSLQQLVASAPGDIDLGWLAEAWAKFKELEGEGNIQFRIFDPPPASSAQDNVGVVPFTPLNQLPASSQATDGTEPFPVYGWLKLRWVTPLVVATGGIQQEETVTLSTAVHEHPGPVTSVPGAAEKLLKSGPSESH
jgi:hypothetical protein